MTIQVYVIGDGSLAEAITQNLLPTERCPAEGVGLGTIIWLAVDTPLIYGDHGDVQPDVEAVKKAWDDFRGDHPAIEGATVVISSQLPLGSCKWFEENYQLQQFVVIPENIRVAHNIQDWNRQARIVVGTRTVLPPALESLLHRWTDTVMYMSPESAELSKSALNGLLAVMIEYGNEIGDLCEANGVSTESVFTAVLTDDRVSRKAPLWPRGPFEGGHLDRELHNLTRADSAHIPLLAMTAGLANHMRKERT